MAGKSYRPLATVVLLIAGYLLVVVGVRAWRDNSGKVVAVHLGTSTAPMTRPMPVLTDSDLPAYEFLLRETESPRPHRRVARTQPTTSVTLEFDPTTVPATQDALQYYYLQQQLRQPVIPLNVARAALDYVGADPEAELVWAYAINDPNLSPSDRSNLIEDLNETGFDPQNVTPNDLPVIVRRLQLIEALAPDAMDDTNAAAFSEAYKDLSNLYNRVSSQLPTEENPATPGC